MERGGTGGALFRAIYRDFLAEAAALVDDPAIRRGHALYAAIAPLWTEVAGDIAAAGRTGDADRLGHAAAILTDLADRERRAMETLLG
jgi:hypothetical protein